MPRIRDGLCPFLYSVPPIANWRGGSVPRCVDLRETRCLAHTLPTTICCPSLRLLLTTYLPALNSWSSAPTSCRDGWTLSPPVPITCETRIGRSALHDDDVARTVRRYLPSAPDGDISGFCFRCPPCVLCVVVVVVVVPFSPTHTYLTDMQVFVVDGFFFLYALLVECSPYARFCMHAVR